MGCDTVQMALTVPEGHHVLWEENTKSTDYTQDRGLLCCVPAWIRISHIVNASTITYNAPATSVPTADNILVDLNCVVTFKIQSQEDAKTFVYKLGAARLDAILSAECEEGIRNLVYSTNHKEVLDLAATSDNTAQIKHSLSAKLMHYGVQIVDIVIVKCELPEVLQSRLEGTTTMISEIEDAKKQHEIEKNLIEYEGQQKILEIEKENKRRVQAVKREIERFRILTDEWEAAARAAVEVNLTNVKAQFEVQQIKCEADEQLATVDGERIFEELTQSTQIDCDQKLVSVRQDAESMKLTADAQLEVARAETQGLIAHAEAEELAAVKLAEKRQYDINLQRLEIVTDFAGKGRKVIVGERADALISEIVPAASMER